MTLGGRGSAPWLTSGLAPKDQNHPDSRVRGKHSIWLSIFAKRTGLLWKAHIQDLMWSREGRPFARPPLSSLWPPFPVAPYGGCCLEWEFIQLFLHLCQGHFLLFILADFFQAQVKTSTLQGSTSTFLLLFAPHIMATTCKVCLSGKPQAANMLRQAEQKTLPCTEEEFLVCPLALKKKKTLVLLRFIYLQSFVPTSVQKYRHTYAVDLTAFSPLVMKKFRGEDSPGVSEWKQFYHSRTLWRLSRFDREVWIKRDTSMAIKRKPGVELQWMIKSHFNHSFWAAALFPRAPSSLCYSTIYYLQLPYFLLRSRFA